MTEPKLSKRIETVIARTDVRKHALAVSEAAKLLDEVQRWEEKGDRLTRRVAALEASPNGRDRGANRSLADRAYEVLRDHSGPMRYREIAVAIRERGFEHAREPKNPEKQLYDSVWTAMHEDDRFTKVGRGIFELSERL